MKDRRVNRRRFEHGQFALNAKAAAQLVAILGEALCQLDFNRATAGKREELALGRLGYQLPLSQVSGGASASSCSDMNVVSPVLRLRTAKTLAFEVGHALGEGRRATLGLSQSPHPLHKVVADLFRRIAKQRVFTLDDGARVTDQRVGPHEDLIAAECHDRRAADRLARHEGYRRHPLFLFQIAQPPRQCPGSLPRSRRDCPISTITKSAPGLLGTVERPEHVVLQDGVDRTFHADQHRFENLGG